VMHAGRIVESGAPDEVFRHPTNPYLAELLSAMARVRRSPGESAHG
jgi:ABC-type dipeptide/oligopeptide/nickel transport system ATPase component